MNRSYKLENLCQVKNYSKINRKNLIMPNARIFYKKENAIYSGNLNIGV